MPPTAPKTSKASQSHPNNASEADITTNLALLHHAEATRLAKSFLSGINFGTSTGTSEDEEAEREKEDQAERDLLKSQASYSDTSGIGYVPPPLDPSSSGGTNARSSAADPTTTFLRKQLLGRGGVARSAVQSQRHHAPVARPQAQKRNREDVDADDKEESRSGVGKKSRKKGNNTKVLTEPRAVDDVAPVIGNVPDTMRTPPITTPTQQRDLPSKKRGTTSYLDELLASRAAKQQKKKAKKTLAEPG